MGRASINGGNSIAPLIAGGYSYGCWENQWKIMVVNIGDGMFFWDLGWEFSEIVHGHSLMIDGILVPSGELT